MGEAAEREEGPSDPESMMRRLEELERARADLDVRCGELDDEEESIGELQRAHVEERAQLERRRVELHHEDAEIAVRREAIDAEQHKLVHERDRLDAEYTGLYQRLDAIADHVAVPSFVPPALTDRVDGVGPPQDPVRESWFIEGAARRITLVPGEPLPPGRITLVPSGPPARITLVPSEPPPVITPPRALPWWKQPRGVAALAASAVALVVVVAIAARPDDPPPVADPAAAFESLRAAILPARTESVPAPALAQRDAAAPVEAPVVTPQPVKRTKKATRPRRPAEKKKKRR